MVSVSRDTVTQLHIPCPKLSIPRSRYGSRQGAKRTTYNTLMIRFAAFLFPRFREWRALMPRGIDLRLSRHSIIRFQMIG